jgi:hypothetical protein
MVLATAHVNYAQALNLLVDLFVRLKLIVNRLMPRRHELAALSVHRQRLILVFCVFLLVILDFLSSRLWRDSQRYVRHLRNIARRLDHFWALLFRRLLLLDLLLYLHGDWFLPSAIRYHLFHIRHVLDFFYLLIVFLWFKESRWVLNGRDVLHVRQLHCVLDSLKNYKTKPLITYSLDGPIKYALLEK